MTLKVSDQFKRQANKKLEFNCLFLIVKSFNERRFASHINYMQNSQQRRQMKIQKE